MRAKRWNERLRLIMAALNATAVGTFGLGAVAPVIAKMATMAPTAAGENAAASALEGLSFAKDVIWPAILAAVVLHLCALKLVSYIEPEE